MHRFMMSGLILIAAVSTAIASDRYPIKKRYVNQTGQVVTIGDAPQIAAYAAVPLRRTLPPVPAVPIIAAISAQQIPQVVVPQVASSDIEFGAGGVDPNQWPGDRSNR